MKKVIVKVKCSMKKERAIFFDIAVISTSLHSFLTEEVELIAEECNAEILTHEYVLLNVHPHLMSHLFFAQILIQKGGYLSLCALIFRYLLSGIYLPWVALLVLFYSPGFGSVCLWVGKVM